MDWIDTWEEDWLVKCWIKDKLIMWFGDMWLNDWFGGYKRLISSYGDSEMLQLIGLTVRKVFVNKKK